MAKVQYHHFGKVSNGILAHYNHPLFQQVVASLEGKEFDLVLKEKYKKVSLDTHGYYRAGIVKECMNYEIFGGYSEDEIHAFFSNLFLKYSKTMIINDAQYQVTRIQSTAELSQSEMNEFVEKVIRWLANEGIVIHSPEQYFLGKYKTEEK